MTVSVPKSARATRAKEAILQAAQQRFASSGFDGTTIRTIAADAKIDPSMVMRYFGSKEGLFTAATSINLALPDFTAIPQAELGNAAARHFLRRWEEDKTSAPLRVLLSSSVTGSAPAQTMRRIFTEQLQPVVMAASACSLPEAEVRAGLVASQILGFALCRYVLKFNPIAEMDHETAVAWLGPTIQRYLAGEKSGESPA